MQSRPKLTNRSASHSADAARAHNGRDLNMKKWMWVAGWPVPYFNMSGNRFRLLSWWGQHIHQPQKQSNAEVAFPLHLMAVILLHIILNRKQSRLREKKGNKPETTNCLSSLVNPNFETEWASNLKITLLSRPHFKHMSTKESHITQKALNTAINWLTEPKCRFKQNKYSIRWRKC